MAPDYFDSFDDLDLLILTDALKNYLDLPLHHVAYDTAYTLLSTFRNKDLEFGFRRRLEDPHEADKN